MKRSNAAKHAKPRFGRHKQTIADRLGQTTFKIGVSLFQSTEAGSARETMIAIKEHRIPKRATLVRPRAREGRDLQPKDAR